MCVCVCVLSGTSRAWSKRDARFKSPLGTTLLNSMKDSLMQVLVTDAAQMGLQATGVG